MIRTVLCCAQNTKFHFVESNKKSGVRQLPRPRWCLLVMRFTVLHILLLRLVELPLHHQMVLQLLGGEGLQKPEGG